MKTDVYIEFQGDKTECRLLTDAARQIWKDDGKLVKDLESIELFFKPEERKCYYIFNGTITGVFNV